jgi:hypothetical protein
MISKFYKEKVLAFLYSRFVYACLLRLILEGYFEVCISSIPVLAYVRNDFTYLILGLRGID